MKIKNKITILFTLLTGTIILVLCIFIYLFAQRNVHENFFHRLEVRSEIVAHTDIEKNQDKSDLYNEFKERYLKNLPSEMHRKIKSKNTDSIINLLKPYNFPDDFIYTAISRGKSSLLKTDTFYVATYVNINNSQVFLLSSAIDESGFEELNSLRTSILIGFTAALIVVFSLGRLLSTIAFRPVKEIIKKVKIIKASNLHLRLEPGKGKDELYDLSVTFNNMLNRLEAAFELQDNFISNASHELKTPLTVIFGEAELALSCNGDPVIMRQSLEKIVSESERLEHLMNSLLSLAQTGYDGKTLKMERIRIDELILSVKMAANRIFPNNKIEVDYDHLPDDETQLTLKGNSVMLKVALLNIFINACKYSGNQKVKVVVHTDKKDIVITVIDTGIGIPKEDLPHIFDTFFRASNTGNIDGYGVGLPLSLNILKIHGGHIKVESEVGKGTTIKVIVPYGG